MPSKYCLSSAPRCLARLKPILESARQRLMWIRVWFSIRDELGAGEDDAYYLAACAKEAFHTKAELAAAKSKKRSK